MAARVVYLVATGQVRPDQVLGLTFTTKAAGELRTRIRARPASRPASSTPRPATTSEDVLEPTVATYNAYAANLLTEHGLRIGHEPDTRVITDASRYQLGARVVDRYTGEVQHLTDHPETAIQNLLALDGAMSEHLRRARRGARASTPRRGRASCAPWPRRRRARTARPTSSAIDKAIYAIDRRARAARAGRGLPPAQGRPRPDGLLRPDRARRPARRRAARGRRGRARQVPGGAARRVPGHLGRPGPDARPGCSPGPTRRPGRARGHRGRRPQPGDLRLARRLGVQHPQLRRDLPGRRAARCRSYPLTVNRRSDAPHPRGRQRLAAAALRRATRRSPRSVAKRRRRAGRRRRPRSSRRTRDELAWLVERVRDGPRRGTGDWSDIGVLTRDNAHAEEVFDALTGAGVPVEIVGLSGLLRLPEVAEIVATLHLLHDVTANAVAADPADRAALGDRPARPAPARPAGRASSPGGRGRARRAPPTSATSCSRSPTASTRPRCPRSATRSTTRATLPYSTEALRAVRAARRRAADAARARRRAAARRRPPDHRHLRRRRRARLGGQPGGAGPARQPRPVRQGGRRVPGGRRRRHACRRCWPTSPPRTTRATASTSPPRPRPTRSSCSPCTGPRASSGHSVFLVGVGRDPVPVQPRPHAVDLLARRCCRRRCAATPATCPQLAGLRQGRARRLPRGHQRPRRRPRSSGSATSPSPAPSTELSVTSYLWSAAHDPVRPLGLPGDVRERARGVGRGGRRLAGQAGEGRRPTPTPATTRRGRGR